MPSLKFRTSGFPQYGFKLNAPLFSSAVPFPCFTMLKCGSHIPILKTWFDKAFVLNHAIGCLCSAESTSRPYFQNRSVQRAFARRRSSVAHHYSYYALIRGSQNHRLTSRYAVIYPALPCGTILAGLETFPTLPVYLFLDAAIHTPEVTFVHIPITSESLSVFTNSEPARQPPNPAHFWYIAGPYYGAAMFALCYGL